MVWCLAKEGSAAVQDQDEGVWIGTFRDTTTATRVVLEHNNNLAIPPPKPIPINKWSSHATWK